MGLLVAVARHLWGPTGTGRLRSGNKKKTKKKKRAAKGGSATAKSDQERAAQLEAEQDAQWAQWAVAEEARVLAEADAMVNTRRKADGEGRRL